LVLQRITSRWAAKGLAVLRCFTRMRANVAAALIWWDPNLVGAFFRWTGTIHE
jgi:hypothetical protein